MEEGKKFDVEFKQTAKGSWYIGSLKVGTDSVDELDKPMTKEEMIPLNGIGERNFEKYGIYFLKVIRSSTLGVDNGK